MSGEIEVLLAAPEEKPALANLFQLYVHDFSEQWAGREEGELEDNGRFAPYPFLDAYWGESSRIPLLVRIDGRLAGFALINAISHSGLAVERNMAEFFIVRKHRRGGAGTAVAQQVFQLYPGLWEAAVARRNTAALAFWRKAVGGCPGLTEVQELDRRTKEWDGPILRFRIKSEPAGEPE
ncbi:MAG TPA: GNAT family N-acetyltransferase [Caulobacteraceae bacterium]|nr:GNAT family N-acetyltransferase [Caulobacteraceae bacterium]